MYEVATDDGTIYRRFSDGDLNPLGDRSRNNAASIGDTWSALQRAATEVYRPSILNETGPYQAQVLMAFRDKAPPASFYDYGANSMQPPPSEVSGQPWTTIPSYDQNPQLPWVVARINELMGHLPDPASFNPSGSPVEKYKYWAAIRAHFDIGVFLPADEDPDYPLPEPGTIIEVDYINTRSFKGGKYRYSGTQRPVGSFPLPPGGGFQHVLNIVHSEENGAEEPTPAPVYEPEEWCTYEKDKGGVITNGAEEAWTNAGINPLGAISKRAPTREKPEGEPYEFTGLEPGIHRDPGAKAMIAAGNLAFGIDVSGHNGRHAEDYNWGCTANWESPEGLKVKWVISKISEGAGREGTSRSSRYDPISVDGDDKNFDGVKGYINRAVGAYEAGMAVSYYHWGQPGDRNYPDEPDEREESARERGRLEAENFCRRIMECRLAIDAENPPMPDFEVWYDLEEDINHTEYEEDEEGNRLEPEVIKESSIVNMSPPEAFRGKLFVAYMKEFIRVVEEVNGYNFGWYVNNNRLCDWVGLVGGNDPTSPDDLAWRDDVPESQRPTFEDLMSIFYQPGNSQRRSAYGPSREVQPGTFVYGPHPDYPSDPEPGFTLSNTAMGRLRPYWVARYGRTDGLFWSPYRYRCHGRWCQADPTLKVFKLFYKSEPRPDLAAGTYPEDRYRRIESTGGGIAAAWDIHQFSSSNADYVPGLKIDKSRTGSRKLDVNMLRIDSHRFNFSDRFKRMLGLPVGTAV